VFWRPNPRGSSAVLGGLELNPEHSSFCYPALCSLVDPPALTIEGLSNHTIWQAGLVISG
jgi:hypothetical protein